MNAAKAERTQQERSERTRIALLDAAFAEIYFQGFQAASLGNIIRAADCTKGALYHHFPDKRTLGLAACERKMDDYIQQIWEKPLKKSDTPIPDIKEIMRVHRDGEIQERLMQPCPVNMEDGNPFSKLSEEMSSQDEGFRELLNSLFQRMRSATSSCLQRGQGAGNIARHVDCTGSADLIIAIHFGILSGIKVSRDTAIAASTTKTFYQYLDSLSAS